MKLTPANILGSWYADETLSWSAQKTVNWIPETAEVEGTRTLVKFSDAPGLRAVLDLGTGSPIRGGENVEGRLFVVSSTSLFDITTGFSATNRGNIPGVSRVSVAHNKQGGGTSANEVFIANGLSGYVFNTATNVLAQVTDEGFEGALTADYVDGYITITDPQGRFWAHSNLNQATLWSTIDRYDAESAPDKIVSHIVSHREVMVFGQRTTEFFRNTGAATGTFQRVDGTELEIGICAPFARARVDNSVCWVGNDLIVYRLNGHSALRISNGPIEQALARVNPANIFCETWEDQGHKVFYVTSPGNFTLGYDFASGMWHERESYELGRWRVNAIFPFNGEKIAGDFSNGLLYAIDWDTHHENGQPLVRERATGYTHADQNKVRAAYAELLFDTGGPGAPLLTLSGDLPGGFNGASGTLQYLAAGGIGPYVFNIISGSLPPGAVMDDEGLVTYTYTTVGSFSWTVMATDAFGQTATLPDTAVVMEAPDDIFEAFLYTGNGVAARTFGTLDMTGGGITFTSQSDGSTATGGSYAMRALPDEYILSNSTHNASPSSAVTFTASGVAATQSVIDGFNTNLATYSMALLRRLPGVFDVVFYTGNGANRTIAHNLGVAPGMYTIFRVSGTTADQMFHRTPGAGIKGVYGNSFGSEAADLTLWNNTAPTTTDFSIGTSADVNTLGVSYVAFLFAHDTNPDGYLFCGNYTGNGLIAGPSVVTGWAPRAILAFPNSQSAGTRTSGIGLFLGASDRWRALAVSGGGGAVDGALFTDNVDGFTITTTATKINQSGVEYRFVAIR